MNPNLHDLYLEEPTEPLWDSVADDRNGFPLTQDQKVELDRRLMAYGQDKNRGRPAGDVLAKIHRHIRDRG